MTPYIYTGLSKMSRLAFLNKNDKPIINAICMTTGISFKEVASPSKKKEISTVRMLICYFLRKKTKLTLKEIGSMLGNRDHATILYNVKKCNDFQRFDIEFKELYKRVEDDINKMSDIIENQ